MIKKREFGKLPDGRVISLYSIQNAGGEYIEVLDFGASIHSIYVKDAKGNLGNVILNVSDPVELLDQSFEGVTIGRYANRIAYGRFEIDGKVTQLETNEGHNYLHGASGNYAFRMFQAEVKEEDNKVVFTVRDNGEAGFGCAVDVTVSFTFGDDHQLKIDYVMIPEDATILCPTNHAYFNLSDGGDVRDHELQIDAAQVSVNGASGVPEGENAGVEGTPVDFRIKREIREAIKADTNGFFGSEPNYYDHCLLLQREDFGKIAELVSPQSGRLMRVYTDLPSIMLYTPPPKEDGRYKAVCIETQFVPNSVNCPNIYRSPVYRKGEKLVSQTIYEFLTLPI